MLVMVVAAAAAAVGGGGGAVHVNGHTVPVLLLHLLVCVCVVAGKEGLVAY